MLCVVRIERIKNKYSNININIKSINICNKKYKYL